MALPEYGQELSEDFLKNLYQDIEERQSQEEGRAKSEAIARGLAGDPTEGSLVGRARSEAGRAKLGAKSDFFYNLAGLQRGERLGREQRGYQVEDRNFGAMEAEKDRSFRERLARMGYDERAKENKKGLLGQVVGAGAGLLGSLGGGWLAGRGGGGMGGGLKSALGGGNKYRFNIGGYDIE